MTPALCGMFRFSLGVPPHVRVLVPQHIVTVQQIGTLTFLSLYVSIDRLSASYPLLQNQSRTNPNPIPTLLSKPCPSGAVPSSSPGFPPERPTAPRHFKIIQLLSHIPASGRESLFLLSDPTRLDQLPFPSLPASLSNGRSTAPNPAMQV